MPASRDATVAFHGAAGTVTGSRHLVTLGGRRILLDCGLFQGVKSLRERNWRPLAFDVKALDAVVLSHAHLDHTGYLPRLVRDGFRGPIYCTPATASLTAELLRDAAWLEEEQAEHANRRGWSRHQPALPLFTRTDAEAAIDRLTPRPYHAAFPVAGDVAVTYRHAGHILGSATVTLEWPRGSFVFSGDLGRWDRPILKDPELVAAAGVLVVEGTYGNRTHAPDPEAGLASAVRDVARTGGVLIIPAFAVGRSQELLWRLRTLEETGAIPPLPVYLDSPMALDVTRLHRLHVEEHDTDMRSEIVAGDAPLRPAHFHPCRTPEESKALNDLQTPAVIISASGMATGGRVLHHLKRRLPDHRTTVLLAGFQAAGTRGRALADGARMLRIHGEEVEVRARIATLDGLSAHADRDELLRWLGGFAEPPRATWVVHAEPEAAEALSALVRERLGWSIAPARDGAAVPLDQVTRGGRARPQ